MNYPLAGFPIASTSDVDEAQSILSHELSDLRISKVGDRSAFRLQMSGVHLGQTMVGFNRFETETLIDPGELENAVVLVIGETQKATIQIDGETVVCNRTAAIISPSKQVKIRREAGSELFVFRTSLDAIKQQFRVMMDRSPGKPITFDRSVDLVSSVGTQVNRLLDSVVANIQQDSTVVENPLLRAGFDQMVLNTLLTLPSNYSNELISDHRRIIAPALVRKAEEYLEARVTEPVTIADLLKQVECSRATLFSAFRSYRDCTPMQFLAELRLKSAHEALQSQSPGNTVSSIAHACGFSHLGRFAAAYRKRFGEIPQETLRRSGSTINA